MRNAPFPVLNLILAAIVGTIFSVRASAHPLTEGALTIAVHPDHISIRARVSVEEVTVTNRLTSPDAVSDPFAAMDSSAYEQHAAYLASHIHVFADGSALPGGVAGVSPPDNPQPSATDMAAYDLLYPLPVKSPAPHRIELRSDVLTESAGPGKLAWQASYVVKAERSDGSAGGTFLLTSDKPVTIQLDARPNAGSLFADYFLHGIHHIFSIRDPGYDHLLFVSALVLGARTLWELIKLVTAFTLAHTITLTLAALNLVRVPEHIVEPLIALSICFVAIENVFWPNRSRGWVRLGVAFFFGLFHGLGFAGALLEAMQGMTGGVVLIAIVAFSLGVEAAHQMVVIPLFLLLKSLRHAHTHPEARQLFSTRAQRFGSAAISLAGLFYLVVALRLSFG